MCQFSDLDLAQNCSLSVRARSTAQQNQIPKQALSYDQNGRSIKMKHQKLNLIRYNHLDLPRQFVFNSGAINKVTYDTGGVKLTQVSASGSRRDYVGGFEYQDYVLKAIPHQQGRAVKETSIWEYEYILQDHLGNTRVRFTESAGVASVVSQHDYYPFGMENNDLSSQGSGDPFQYRYNGKELNEEIGLYDYGARWYDPAIARWGQVDPSAEQYLAYSPYNYTLNNPILYIDPDGRRVEYGDNVSREDKKAFKKRIRTLRKQSKTFKSLWKDLKKSKHTHTISFTDKSSGTSTTIKDLDGYRSGENRGTNITVNLDDSSAEGVEVGNEIAIGHEVGHAWRADQGKTVIADEPRQMTADELLANPNGPIEQLQQYEEAASAAQINEEVQTSHIENIIRSEVSASSGREIPLRKQYSNLTKAVRTRFGVSRKNYNAPTIRPGYNYSGNVEHYSKLKSGN